MTNDDHEKELKPGDVVTLKGNHKITIPETPYNWSWRLKRADSRLLVLDNDFFAPDSKLEPSLVMWVEESDLYIETDLRRSERNVLGNPRPYFESRPEVLLAQNIIPYGGDTGLTAQEALDKSILRVLLGVFKDITE